MSQVLTVEKLPYDAFVRKVDVFLKNINELIKNILELDKSWDQSHDARIDDIKIMRESVQNFLIIHESLAASFDNLELWKLQKFESDKQRFDFLSDRLHFLTAELETNLFFNLFLRFENFIRLITQSVGITGDSLNQRVSQLIDSLKIDSDYKGLLNIIIYTRNLIHTGGIRVKDDIKVTYKGKEYHFEKGKTPEFWNFDSMLYFFSELFVFILLIVSNNTIKDQSKINHNYSNITFDYEV